MRSRTGRFEAGAGTFGHEALGGISSPAGSCVTSAGRGGLSFSRRHVTGLSTTTRNRCHPKHRVVRARTWRRGRGRSGDRHSRTPSEPCTLTPASLRRPTPMPSRLHGERYDSSTAWHSVARLEHTARSHSTGRDPRRPAGGTGAGPPRTLKRLRRAECRLRNGPVIGRTGLSGGNQAATPYRLVGRSARRILADGQSIIGASDDGRARRGHHRVGPRWRPGGA
jgi:hypothetical protein